MYICRNKNKETMTTLTEKQRETFEILVRLVDSKELALKTVLSQEEKEDSEMYYNAYCL